MNKLALMAASSVIVACTAETAPAGADEQVRIVGSSTVFPFSTAVAEQFGAASGFATPVVESTGSGGGMQLFCAGVGESHPDITNASRRMKDSEWDLCQENGVTDIVEMVIGFDGIVLANANEAPEFDLSLGDIYTALAAQVPTADDDCTMIDNPNARWSDIDPALPDQTIEVFGPPPTSGTRDAFVELAMENGARAYACMNDLRGADKDAFTALAHTLREDGAWIDAGENDNAIVSTLTRTPTAIGVFGYSFLDQNSDRIRGAMVNGVEPTFDAIAEGAYPVSRSLYVYLKSQHVGVVPGIHEFALEFASEGAWGEFGYLADRGLIPLPAEARAACAAVVEDMTVMTGSPDDVEDCRSAVGG